MTPNIENDQNQERQEMIKLFSFCNFALPPAPRLGKGLKAVVAVSTVSGLFVRNKSLLTTHLVNGGLCYDVMMQYTTVVTSGSPRYDKNFPFHPFDQFAWLSPSQACLALRSC